MKMSHWEQLVSVSLMQKIRGTQTCHAAKQKALFHSHGN